MNGGTLIRVIPKTLFDFGYLPGGTTDGVIVAKALNVIPYSSAHLWVRVYQRRVDTGASAQVVVTGALPDENTQFSFLDSSSTTLTISGTAPTLLNAAWPAGSALPPYLQIEVQGTQPGTPRTLEWRSASICWSVVAGRHPAHGGTPFVHPRAVVLFR